MSLPKETAPCRFLSSQLTIFWLIIETSSKTSSPMFLICAVREATAAEMWLWSSKPSWLWGDSWVGDAGGVSRSGWLTSYQFLGLEERSVSFFGVSGLGRLGGCFGVEAGRGSWNPMASPILMLDMGQAIAMFVLGGRRGFRGQILTKLALCVRLSVDRSLCIATQA